MDWGIVMSVITGFGIFVIGMMHATIDLSPSVKTELTADEEHTTNTTGRKAA